MHKFVFCSRWDNCPGSVRCAALCEASVNSQRSAGLLLLVCIPGIQAWRAGRLKAPHMPALFATRTNTQRSAFSHACIPLGFLPLLQACFWLAFRQPVSATPRGGSARSTTCRYHLTVFPPSNRHDVQGNGCWATLLCANWPCHVPQTLQLQDPMCVNWPCHVPHSTVARKCVWLVLLPGWLLSSAAALMRTHMHTAFIRAGRTLQLGAFVPCHPSPAVCLRLCERAASVGMPAMLTFLLAYRGLFVWCNMPPGCLP